MEVILDRFWSKVQKTEGCWYYTAGKSHDGYGQFWSGKRNQYAHRFIYELLVGVVPPGQQLDHTCHRPSECSKGNECPHRCCVNPAHLELVTSKTNTLRGNSPSALNKAKTHCPKGHEYTPENTYRTKNSRHCRECSLGWMRRYGQLHRDRANERARISYHRRKTAS